MPYAFRLRVRTLTTLAEEGGRTATLTLEGFPPIEVTVTSPPVGTASANFVTLIGRDFANENEAEKAGRLLSNTLLIYGAISGIGVDVGFDTSTLSFSASIHEAVQKSTGKQLRPDVFGLMTFEQDAVVIQGISMHLKVHTTVERVEQELPQWLAPAIRISARQRIAAALLCDALYLPQPEAKLLLAVSSVEALCDQHALSEEHLRLVDLLSLHLETLEADDDAKVTLRRTLQHARTQSIRNAYMSKIRHLLDGDTAKRFDRLYALRSGFVHEGSNRGELASSATEARDIAVRLLSCELQAH